MIDFIEYVVGEIRGKRLSKENALELIRQFSGNAAGGASTSMLHPLLQRNASSIDQQCYRSTLDGEEFFLDDHRIVTAEGTAKVLPGVAYLEMARAAVKDAVPGLSSTDQVWLDDVVWLQPIIVDEAKEVSIRLLTNDDQKVEFEVFTQAEAVETIHCRGRASWGETAAVDELNLDAIRSRVSARAFDSNTMYPAYRKMGMQFGPAHRAVNRVFVGDGEVLAELSLPESVSSTLQSYQLHPSLMDGALQASIGLSPDFAQLPERPALPFALQSLQVFAGCQSVMVAWIRHSKDTPANDSVSRLDIDLCDGHGNVCVRLNGFSSRVLAARTEQKASLSHETGLVLANPVWKSASVECTREVSGIRQHVLLCGLPGIDAQRMQALLPDSHCHSVRASDDGIAERFTATALECFRVVRAILDDKGKARVHIVVPAEGGSTPFFGLSGLLKTAALEHPQLMGQLLIVDDDVTSESLAARLRVESAQTADPVVRYEGDTRQRLSWEEPVDAGVGTGAFKEGGVYLITGGLGGLGKLFATEILTQTRRARIVLTGRTQGFSAIEAQLNDWLPDADVRARVEYRSLDVTDASQVERLLNQVVEAHGQLNGILHAAGMIADDLIGNKTPEQFAQVLAPKVAGTVNLDRASARLDLDFLALFSSGAALLGNVGQADYAVANGFMDQFAGYRNRLRAAGQRKGITVSINWPLWQDGGMQMNARDQQAMREQTGMQAMTTHSGMAVFHRILNSEQSQTAVVEGDRVKIRSLMFGEADAVADEIDSTGPADHGAISHPATNLTRDYLRQQFSALFKLPASKIDPRAPLEKYGIDSILAMDLTRQLEKSFGPLSKTLFFEYQTIDELAGFLVQEYPAKLGTLFERVETARATPASIEAKPRPSRRNAKPRVVRHETVSTTKSVGPEDDPIAIVGLSGRYPESPDIASFWNNLRDGKDCITEVPPTRWDWREYFSEDRTAEGRHYSKWGGFIAGVDEFDPLFFNIAPSEAGMMDPQERLFLQHTWQAIEDAGYTRASLQTPHDSGLPGQVGVYVGVMYGEYQLLGAESSLRGKRIGIPVSYASIANRVSYVLNLHGPSMTLDTMCSSSLTAIHLACQDLRQGRTTLAIAGGVNVTIHPNKYLILSAGQFISSDGHCQSFGEGGDGYIPGEGVGVVILKKLSEALRDGNHIYGLIRGSALNHGGKTNGYSVPNPKAQSAVIAQALQDGRVDARRVSYLEAHGTGTKLGDPIEIAALTQVFRRHTHETQFCALGSAKSNIGHCESAAGIAGLTKVLLQMKHGMIAPSLHSTTLNPHIDFQATPFLVNQTLRPWDAPVIDGETAPRIAGISSFGAGGSNAHLIVEEYPVSPGSAPHVAEVGPQVIVLSARTAQQLQQKASDLLAFLRQQDNLVDLPSMAYTLQIGREVMDVRLAFVVDSVDQLVEKLESSVRGDTDIDQVFQGRIDRDADDFSVLGHDEEMREAIDKWIARGKLGKLAELWAKGLELDWRRLHAERRPRFISLPAYPFARERHWIDMPSTGLAAAGPSTSVLHPLVHTNTSDFFQQSYGATFGGDEFFLSGHQIDTGGSRQKVLPAVAYLEMVRVSLDLAWPGAEPRVIELKNAAWSQPLMVDARKRVSVALQPGDDGNVEFEICSRGEAAEETTLHCRGRAAIGNDTAPADLDIDSLKAQMTKDHVAGEKVYAAFRAMGMHYGNSFQCITSLHRGNDQVLAELNLPSALERHVDDYLLHPGLSDAALQASIGLLADLNELPVQPSIPFALDTLRMMAPCKSQMFAWVRHSTGARPDSGITKLDIDLCDSHGRVCAQMRGLTSRALKTREIGSLLMQPGWASLPAASVEATVYERHDIILCNLPSIDGRQLEALQSRSTVRHLALSNDDTIAVRYRVAAVACFEQLQSLLKQGASEQTLFQLVMADDGNDSVLAGLSGLIRTARLENPKLIAQVLLTARGTDERTLAEQLRTAANRPSEAVLRWQGTECAGQRWQPVEADCKANAVTFKDGGVYLITGGLGGLGQLFATAILKSTRNATVILTGRSELTDDKRRALEQLRTELAVDAEKLTYATLDLDACEAVDHFVSDLVARHGHLNGVIHSAGMIRDRLIVNKTADEFAQVLSPKVTGTFNIDRATRAVELDFLVLFSSVAGAMGNAGQADYATANAFMDRFAGYRNRLVEAGGRRGRTLSINWPLWEEGGMQLDAQAKDALLGEFGIVPMQTATGLQAFNDSLQLPLGQTLVLEGDKARLRQLFVSKQSTAPAISEVEPAGDAAVMTRATQRWLTAQVSDLLKIPAHEIEPKAPLERYGIDSVLAMKLTQRLEQSFGSLSKTLFFEYQTLASLAGYLVKAFPKIVRDKTGLQAPAAPAAIESRTSASATKALVPSKSRFVRARERAELDVAIVGLGGRYPQADDLQQFWDNLKNGRDCITEVPRERWDNARFFHAERNQAGKTYSKWGGFMDGVDRFDPLFFNISPREAQLIDPQERLFLETVWETIEDAGYSKDSIARHRVGVFVGAMWGQYELFGVTAPESGMPSSSFASIANRISYFFDFHGPSMAVDTMCSSSLTAIHLACEEIRKGTVDVAIAGGVNVSIHPAKYLSLSQGNFAASDGRCRSFGAGGDGYVPGEGVGAVLLKPLHQALADGDQVYAIVKASTVNHGGKTNGYTVPNPVAQSELIADAIARAGIDPGTIGYIETHGTGTSLGDPIEIAGLTQAFDRSSPTSDRRQRCPIGSVKSNIGHLESAAGIAAVTKSLLQIKHRQLAPSLHAEPLNPNIDFTQTPFYVQTKLEDWTPREGQPRRIAISSFGAGGSNAHLILEEVFDTRRVEISLAGPQEAFVLSAKSSASLQTYARKMLAFLDGAREVSIADLAFTSQVGRTPMPERLVVLAASVAMLKDKLTQWLRAPDEMLDGVYTGNARASKANPPLVPEDDEGDALIRGLLKSGELAQLAKLWIGGVDIDWALLDRSGARPRRVSLPTYPFTKERYWISDAGVSAPAPVQVQPQEQKQLMHYEPEWRAAGLATSTSSPQGTLLILDADDKLYREVKRAAPDAQILLVKYGAAYKQLAPHVYTIDPEQEADAQKLMETLQLSGRTPRAIVHNHVVVENVGQQLAQGLYAVHHLCKALMKSKPTHAIKIISSRVAETSELSALHDALGGFFRTLALENPQFAGKCVTLDKRDPTEIARTLLAELSDEQWSAEVLHLRGREVKQLRRHAPAATLPAHTAIKQNGVYLVTGGLGGLGYLFGEHLVRAYRCKLALLGRSALSEDQQRKLEHLQSFGADVRYFQADVCDRDRLIEAVREMKERFGQLNGVIHSAGIHRDSFILNKRREDMQAVLAAKVAGTLNLDAVTRDEQLDLFVMFSSVAAALGNPGQSDYAFANSFMDAFAEQRETLRRSGQRSGKTLSINWPFWEAGGMQLSQSDLDLAEARSGVCPLPTARGIQFLEDSLHLESSQAIVLFGVAEKIDAAVLPKPVRSVARPLPPQVAPAVDHGILLAKTESYLAALLSREIKLPEERIDSHEPFASYGVDSMMINRINASLGKDLGELPQTLLYQYETIAALAEHLTQQAQPALAKFLKLSGDTAAPIQDREEQRLIASEIDAAPERRDDEADPIAIIGVNCRFPHSQTLGQYWANLRQGKDLIDPVPADRWDAQALEQDIYCKWGGFLQEVDRFDAPFFSISKTDAQLMDPQERLFLQSVWSAIENAGYTRERLKRCFPKASSADVGVFAGVTTNSYSLLGAGHNVTPGAMPWSLANRVSYFFDFKGPSVPIDTACSSSLVALHQACESLRRGECQLAIAGGVNLYLHPAKYQSLCSRRMLAVGNRCRSFGAGDDGFIPGEGVGALVLKPLSRAVADGDHIYGVIAASSVEHSGRSNGYGAPNPTSQGNLIEQTLRKANIHPESIGYVEGHGTGTQLGDSLEVASLTAAFRRFTAKEQFCPIGSVKANVGHAESAAGLAGVAKILLQFEQGQIAPTIHSSEVNPNIVFEKSPFYLQHELAAWEPANGQPRRAMINSFGAGGVNSCVILEQHRSAECPARPVEQPQLVVLSARSEAQLRESASQLQEFLLQAPAVDLASLAYTLQAGREAMQERVAVVVSSAEQLQKELKGVVEGKQSSAVLRGTVETHRKKKRSQQAPEAQVVPSLSDEWRKVGQAWIEGAEVNWDDCHRSLPRKLPLPTYPFAKQRYWVSDMAGAATPSTPKAQEPRLHPLVAHNVSTLQEVCFSSLLDANEYYARDHKVSGRSIFPGAGFLEIACINGAIASERRVTAIRDIVWNQPLQLVEASQRVKSFLKANGSDTEYVIVSFDADNERVVHSEGRLVHDGEERREPHGNITRAFDLQSLKSRCTKRLPGSQCYQTFERFGLQYGPSFQTIQELHVGSDFALARLQLSESLARDFERYILHPSLIDGALQAVIGLASDGPGDAPFLPFALDEVELLQPLAASCYAYVELATSEGSSNAQIKRFNIRLLSDNGDTLVRLSNFYVRALRDVQPAQTFC